MAHAVLLLIVLEDSLTQYTRDAEVIHTHDETMSAAHPFQQ